MAKGIKRINAGDQDKLGIENLKYSPNRAECIYPDLPLKRKYGHDRITLLIRDPRWIFAYWEITPASVAKIKKILGAKFTQAKKALRVYEVKSSKLEISVEIIVNNKCLDSWYIETGAPGKAFCAEIGYLLDQKHFFAVCRSNIVNMPPEGVSEKIDEEWMSPDEKIFKIYSAGLGLASSPPVEDWQKRQKLAIDLFSKNIRPKK